MTNPNKFNFKFFIYLPRILFKLFKIRVLNFTTASFCKHCGRDVHDFSTTDEIWEQVDPHIKFGHTLCYDCFCEICEKIGLPSTWKLEKI